MLNKSLQHAQVFSVSCVFTGFLVMASNAINPSASMFQGSGPCWLVPISQLNYVLPGHSLLARAIPHTLMVQALHSLTTISRLLTLMTTLHESLSHAVFPVMIFSALLGDIFQQRTFLCSRAHIFIGWWFPTPRWLASISQILSIAIQWLTTIGAPLPPTPPLGVTVSASGCLGLPAPSLNFTQLSSS
jgi:hypothetical protein